jgi:hypothetical protein
MFQVRFALGAAERNTLSVAVFTAALVGIEHEARSNFTKARLFLVVVNSRTVVWYDRTSRAVADPKFELSSSSTWLSADGVSVHVDTGTLLAAVRTVRDFGVIASAAAKPTPVETTATRTATRTSQRSGTPRLTNPSRPRGLRRRARIRYGPVIETWYPATFWAAGFGLTEIVSELSVVSPSVAMVCGPPLAMLSPAAFVSVTERAPPSHPGSARPPTVTAVTLPADVV